MQSCEQGMAVLVWQSKIITLFKLAPPYLLFYSRDERYIDHALLMLGARQTSSTRLYLEVPNPTYHIHHVLFCSET
jgi:hypothetical protein